MKYKIRFSILIFLIIIVISSTLWNVLLPKKEYNITQNNNQIQLEEFKNTNFTEEIKTPKDNNLEEKNFVENYIKENINTIATNKPVLGGTWYITSITIDESTSDQTVPKSGRILYEDGHITSEATFIYTYQKDPEDIKIHEFIVKE